MTDTSVDVEALDRWIRRFAEEVSKNKDLLTDLDSAIGDADHGSNMDRGMSATVAALDEASSQGRPLTTAGALLKTVGMTVVSSIGGASGPLYGTLFLRMGTSAGDVEALDDAGFSAALTAGLAGVVARGKAELGDKTMCDALAPACAALDASLAGGAGLSEALAVAATSADTGRDATIPMLARKGRASYLGERSIGHQDPGATSVALLVNAAAATLGSRP
ncbi:MAG: dihydroxyacetone kinase subunit L [Dermatophilaceae bacterium]|nr:dihydroxyacetone kinase subunit L [Dermatophilaceae bacterium]